MNFTITFSHIVEEKRVPLIIEGKEVTLNVEATSKTEAIGKPEVKVFCEQYEECRVRGVR